jgi:hypothetical protein
MTKKKISMAQNNKKHDWKEFLHDYKKQFWMTKKNFCMTQNNLGRPKRIFA